MSTVAGFADRFALGGRASTAKRVIATWADRFSLYRAQDSTFVDRFALDDTWADRFVLGGTSRTGARTILALDRASVRRYDLDGRLHVSEAPLSKANICPYYGKEIPDFAELGLEPEKIYQLYRPAEELQKSVPSFNNLPVLSEHVPVTATDHRPDLVVGASGTDAKFTSPYLTNSLVIWAADAIDGIESGRQRELSSAYRYVPVMRAGTFQSTPYDGRMTQIEGSHVALVEEGRAGSDVMVGDSKFGDSKVGDSKFGDSRVRRSKSWRG